NQWAREYASQQIAAISGNRKSSTGAENKSGAHESAVVVPDNEPTKQALSSRGESTLIEALTYLPSAGWHSRDGQQFTEAGRGRLENLAGLIRQVRAAIHSDLPDLIAHVSQIFGIELAAATRATGGQRVRTSIDSFVALGGGYQRDHPGASLADFLAWMETSDEKEHGGEEEAGIESVRAQEDIEVNPGVVQIMTVHSAKGLEWRDLVAIPEVVDGEFSDITSATSWLTRSDVFPFPLRADYQHLPHFRPSDYTDKFDAAGPSLEFKKVDLPRYESQEARRLAYVAFTRPRGELVLAGYGLKSPEKAKPVASGRGKKNVVSEDPLTIELKARSSYLMDMRADARAHVTPIGDLAGPDWPAELTEEVGEDASVEWLSERLGEDAVNPPVLEPVPHYDDLPDLARWPQAVPRTLGGLAPLATDAGPDQWRWQANVLIAEQRETGEVGVTRPYYTATDMVHLSEDGEAFIANQRRPIPNKPSRAARVGTNTHAKIAHHFTEPAMLDIDSLLDLPASDVDMDSGREETMYEAFMASPWASCEPLAIEQSLEIVVAGHIIRCTIDAVLDTSSMAGRGAVTIVDWKTGRRPRAADLASRELQLALYRLAWSRAHKVPLSEIGACFVYLSEPESRQVLEAGELTEEQITERIAAALDS
ncbi:MAG: 3'-5' exonuclease, partial [Ancrocorticia sp.]|uniref:3'-5' exonuclease n=1 Tax=Ancrocorticia sp. TaxID=2593684 RepID=UPI003F91552A